MLRRWIAVCLVLLASLAGAVPVFASNDSAGSQGAVYMMTNAAAGNQVMAYQRAADGTLTYLDTYNTGGLGSGPGVTVPPDPLGSQNGLLLSPDGKWLFAVNAGSNSVTVFRVGSGGQLARTGQAGSGGSYPVSLTVRDNILFVLNAAGDGSISGFRLSKTGRLAHIQGSTRSLHAATPADGAQPQILESPAQVGFSPDGRWLIVTDKGGVSKQGRILVFPVNQNGIPGSKPSITITQTPVPFSFTFDSYDHLVVVDAGPSTVTTYAISDNGDLDMLVSVATGQPATCWIAFNGRYLFTDNTGGNTISALQTARDGSITLLNGAAASTGMGTLPLDVGISHGGGFLYSLEVGAGVIGEYQINADGSLTTLGTIGSFPMVGGAQGIAVR